MAAASLTVQSSTGGAKTFTGVVQYDDATHAVTSVTFANTGGPLKLTLTCPGQTTKTASGLSGQTVTVNSGFAGWTFFPLDDTQGMQLAISWAPV